MRDETGRIVSADVSQAAEYRRLLLKKSARKIWMAGARDVSIPGQTIDASVAARPAPSDYH